MGLPLLVGIWFQVLLTPLKRVLFTFQSPYWSTIGHRVVLSLGGWSPLLHTEFHGIRATLDRRHYGMDLRLQDCHLLWWTFPDPLTDRYRSYMSASATPVRRPVWADPLSLAATHGVSVDFLSSRY